MQKVKIYLDDERTPQTNNDWTIVKNYTELKSLLYKDIVVEEISFDHDLGEELNGLDCLKLLIDIDMERVIFSNNFKYNFHTANPCGRENMNSLIKSYLKYKRDN